MATGVGVAFDPAQLGQRFGVQCAYPTDAGTDARDGGGCGPPSWDPAFGSRGYAHLSVLERAAVRAGLEGRKAASGKAWGGLSCADFLYLPQFQNASAWAPADRTSLDECRAVAQDAAAAAADPARTPVYPMAAFVARSYEPFVGHPVCNHDAASSTCSAEVCAPGSFFEWEGACSWEPAAFQAVVDAQAVMVRRGPELLKWNEVVLDRAAAAPEAVGAVFWVDYPALPAEARAYLREAARLKAEALAAAAKAAEPVPVVKVTPTPEAVAAGAVFGCEDEDGRLDADGAGAAEPAGLRDLLWALARASESSGGHHPGGGRGA